jgi:hypothetical protein
MPWLGMDDPSTSALCMVPWKIHGPHTAHTHARTERSKHSFMAIWLGGQFVTRCPQVCPFRCMHAPFLSPLICLCVCVLSDACTLALRGTPSCPPSSSPSHRACNLGSFLELFLSWMTWDLGASCVWMVAWSAGHAIVWLQKVAGRPAIYICQNALDPWLYPKSPVSFSNFFLRQKVHGLHVKVCCHAIVMHHCRQWRRQL